MNDSFLNKGATLSGNLVILCINMISICMTGGSLGMRENIMLMITYIQMLIFDVHVRTASAIVDKCRSDTDNQINDVFTSSDLNAIEQLLFTN